jgi:hypothetical protein
VFASSRTIQMWREDGATEMAATVATSYGTDHVAG